MKSKMYTQAGRKPMMYGGDAGKKRMTGTPQPTGERAREKMNPKGATTMQDITGASDAQMQAQREEELRRNNTRAELEAIANGTGMDAYLARKILNKPISPGDQQPAGMMYGGKAGKK